MNSEVGPSTYDPSRVIQRKRFGGTFDLPTADEIDALPLDRRMKLGLPPEMWRVEAKKEEDDDDDRFIYQSTPSERSQRRWKMGGRAPRWQAPMQVARKWSAGKPDSTNSTRAFGIRTPGGRNTLNPRMRSLWPAKSAETWPISLGVSLVCAL